MSSRPGCGTSPADTGSASSCSSPSRRRISPSASRPVAATFSILSAAACGVAVAVSAAAGATPKAAADKMEKVAATGRDALLQLLQVGPAGADVRPEQRGGEQDGVDRHQAAP